MAQEGLFIFSTTAAAETLIVHVGFFHVFGAYISPCRYGTVIRKPSMAHNLVSRS